MNNLDILKLRHEAVIRSDSDPLFYKNVHAYIDIIVKTPQFAFIIDESEKDYQKEFREIWRVRKTDDKEIDYQTELVRRLEQYSLYAAHYCTLLVRIYEPLEEHKNPTPELKDRLDPVALLMLDGFKETDRKGLWNTNRLKTFNKWFNGKRKDYENNLTQFHVSFIEELVKRGLDSVTFSMEKNPSFKKISLFLHPRTGDFNFHKLSGTIAPSTQEFKILYRLLNSEDYQCDYLSLYREIHPGLETLQKTHKYALALIIRNLKEKLGILPKAKSYNPDIFVNIPNIGYRLVFTEPKEIPE